MTVKKPSAVGAGPAILTQAGPASLVCGFGAGLWDSSLESYEGFKRVKKFQISFFQISFKQGSAVGPKFQFRDRFFYPGLGPRLISENRDPVSFDKISCIFGLRKNFWEFDIFLSYERARLVGHRNWSSRSQKLTLDFKKNPKDPKMDRKSQNIGKKLAALTVETLCIWYDITWRTQITWSKSKKII